MTSVKGSAHITSVLLLVLVALGVAALLWVWLEGRAGSPASPPPRLEVSVEAVKAYAVPGLGTFIGIYERNVGSASIEINRLEELGISVYVYDWRGDLVAYNTSARVAKEGVPDGVWEPGELIVIEAFIPVVLSGASFAVTGPVTGGYLVVEEIGARGSVARLEATLPPSNIIVVEGGGRRVCYLVVPPGGTLAFNSLRVTGGAPLTATTLYSVTLRLVYLNETTAFTVGSFIYGGFYAWSVRLLPWLPPFLFLTPFFAYITVACDTGGATGAIYSIVANPFGTATPAKTNIHTFVIDFRVPQPAGFYQGVYANYSGTTLSVTYDSSSIVTLSFDYLQSISSYFLTASTLVYNSPNGYLGVASVTLTYYDAATGTTRTLTWSPSGPDDQPPSWLTVPYYTIECHGTNFQPSW